MDQFFLAGEDKTSPSFLFRIMDGAAEHYSRISFLPACRNRIQPENHLPCAMFIMHVCFLIHFVSKIRKVCHHTVRKRNQFSLFKEEPEMIAVISEPLFERILRRRFGRRKTLRFHRRYQCQIIYRCFAYFHKFLFFPFLYTNP